MQSAEPRVTAARFGSQEVKWAGIERGMTIADLAALGLTAAEVWQQIERGRLVLSHVVNLAGLIALMSAADTHRHRRCMCCQRMFLSEWLGNRLCSPCGGSGGSAQLRATQKRKADVRNGFS